MSVIYYFIIILNPRNSQELPRIIIIVVHCLTHSWEILRFPGNSCLYTLSRLQTFLFPGIPGFPENWKNISVYRFKMSVPRNFAELPGILVQINTKEFSENSREFLGFILGLFPEIPGNSREFCAN